jgi:sortase A
VAARELSAAQGEAELGRDAQRESQFGRDAQREREPSRSKPAPRTRSLRELPPTTERANTTTRGVIGRLEIPRLRIEAMVAEGTDAKTLDRAIGHVRETALPGKPGNVGLAGHRDTFLRGLGDVRADDVIRIVTAERTYTYEVQWTKVVEPDRVDTLDPTAKPSLTLVTCYPFAYVGRAPQRFLVRARQVDSDPLAARARPAAFPQGGLIAEGR